MSNNPDWKSKFIFVKETLIFDIHPGLMTDFRHGQGTFSYPYPTKPFDEDLWNHLRRHTLEAQTFSEPILYLVGLSSSWEHALNNPSIFVDGEEMAFRNFMKKTGQSPSFSVSPADQPIDVGIPSVDPLRVFVDNDQVESSYFSKDKDVSGFELAIIRECVPGQDDDVAEEEKPEVPRRMSVRGSVPPLPAAAPKGVGRHHRVLARYIGNLASNSDSLAPSIYQRAHSAHNMISGLHYPLLRDKLRAHKNQDVEHSQVLRDLRSENAQTLEELSMMWRVAASAEESRKKLFEELDGLQPRLREAEHLGQRCQDLERERDFLLKKSKEVTVLSLMLEATNLEKDKLVKDFLPLVVKKLFESEHFNQTLGDLQQKAITFGRSQALDEVHRLVEKAGQSFEELAAVEAPAI
ncbi:hypothetical protein Tco_1104986 [Tanacetum coccineum]